MTFQTMSYATQYARNLATGLVTKRHKFSRVLSRHFVIASSVLLMCILLMFICCLICIVDISLFNNRPCLGMTAEEGSTALETPEGSEVKKFRLNPESDNVSSIHTWLCLVWHYVDSVYIFRWKFQLNSNLFPHRSMLLIYQVDIIFRPTSNSSLSAFAR